VDTQGIWYLHSSLCLGLLTTFPCSQFLHSTAVMCSVPEAEVTGRQAEGYTRHGLCITAEQVCRGTSVWGFHGSQMQGFFAHICSYTERCYTLCPTNGTILSLMSLELRSPITSNVGQHWLLFPIFIISACSHGRRQAHWVLTLQTTKEVCFLP
jgi:hypothetical protein